MIAAGFPPEPRIIAEGIGVVHAESGGDASEDSQGESGHIGLWAESPAFGSAKCRLDPLCSTKAAYKIGWLPTKSFYSAWGRWEAEQSGKNGATNAPEHMSTATSVISQVKAHGRQTASKSSKNHGTVNVNFEPLNPGSWVGTAEELLHGGLLEQGPKGQALGPAGAGSEVAENVGGGILGPIIAPITTIAETFKVVGELLFTPQGWLRIGKLLGGAIFLVWGIEQLIQASGPQVAKKGSSLVKDAAIAAVVK